MIENFRVVDGHVHTFASKEIALKIRKAFNKIYDIKFVNPGTGTIDEVINNMESLGIDYTVMTNFASAKIVHENNLWTLEIADKHNNFIPLVSFHPNMEGNKSELLENYIKKGAKGIKLHPMAQNFNPNSIKMKDLYKQCNELKFPIVFHCGRVSNARINEFSDVDVIVPIIEKYSCIPFVITHMADGNVEDVLRLSRSYSNVYFDTSIVITGYPSIMETNEPSWLDDNTVVDVINEVGAHRVIFGSDYPWGSVKHDLPRILNLKINDEQKKMILGENAINLYKVE